MIRFRSLCAAAVFLCLSAGMGVAAKQAAAPDTDPYLWLADIHGAKALAWAQDQTKKTKRHLTAGKAFARDRDTLLAMLNAPGRIAKVTLHGDHVRNFWQDKDHPRGLWRRAAVADYLHGKPQWQTLFDLDAFDRQTGKPFVWKGADCTAKFERCLVMLSPDGGDAVVIREYDPAKRAFVKGGFSLPLGKSTARYLDAKTIVFAADQGSASLTNSGYPRIVKLWRRGQPIATAQTVYEGKRGDVWARPAVFHGPYGTVPLIVRGTDFFNSDYFYLRPDGTVLPLPLPKGADLKGVSGGRVIATLRDGWTPSGQHAIAQGSLIAFPVIDYVVTSRMPRVDVLFTPDAHSMIGDVAAGRDAVYAAIYRDVTGSIHAFRHERGQWSDTVLALPKDGSTAIMAANDWGPEALFTFESFLVPPTLYAATGTDAPRKLQTTQAFFDASKFAVSQRWATSADGTKIPYFLIRPKKARGPIPTILYGYGGFEVSLTPWYWNDPVKPLGAGQLWLEKGGAMAIANIRGGGEFGPRWHQAALTVHRQRAFDDFEAVAKDIETNHLATRWSLGIVGASNGGLLVTTAMVQQPKLFGAVVCQRPLIDMLRYTRYGAGASWIAEYGDPADPKMRQAIEKYSPYQNVKAGVRYPPILFITETSDDRVTPVFARMMAAKMEAQHHRVWFYESPDGGHGPGATHAEQAAMWALSFAHFRRALGLKP